MQRIATILISRIYVHAILPKCFHEVNVTVKCCDPERIQTLAILLVDINCSVSQHQVQ